MPEYLAPGVYVEETSFRSKSIEGVSTSTTGFVGATRYGPIFGEPELVTSFTHFERIYGGLDKLNHEGEEVDNYLAHAVRAFFDNGGSRLYVGRAYGNGTRPAEDEPDGRAKAIVPPPTPQLAEAATLALNVTSTTLAALDQSARALERAKAASTSALRILGETVRSKGDLNNPIPVNYDYGAGPNVFTQLNDAITALPDGEVKTNLTTSLTANTQNINLADKAYADARTALEQITAAKPTISEAYQRGVAEGKVAPLANAVNVDVTVNALTAAANGVSLTNLNTQLGTLNEDIKKLNSPASAGQLARTASQIVTAAEDITTKANATPTPIKDVARDVTIGQLSAEAAAPATFEARFPGEAGNMTVIIVGRLGANSLRKASDSDRNILASVRPGDLVVVVRPANAFIYEATRANDQWVLMDKSGTGLNISDLVVGTDQVLTLNISVQTQLDGKYSQPQLWNNLTTTRLASRQRDSVHGAFGPVIPNRAQELETPLLLNIKNSTLHTAALAGALIGVDDWKAKLDKKDADSTFARVIVTLKDGSDGTRPTDAAYAGLDSDNPADKSGLRALEGLEDISIVAAPGYSHDHSTRANTIAAINQALISHCERMKYRVAVLDTPNAMALSQVRDYRAALDSKYAALYYPWVRIMDPITEQPIDVPPSGFLSGIYARNDNENGVHKAPANEVVRGAIRLETLLNKAQQDVLNPLGIDCLRYFEGRGFTVWGARTISSDPEWKYLNVRRYFIYLEASIDRSTQWAVFEPNGEALWANVRRTVEDFLFNEWKEGRLAGSDPETAFFVRCDRSTMTQNDLDNGRMICLIGVAPLYPAEFVIFRIGQWTADRE